MRKQPLSYAIFVGYGFLLVLLSATAAKGSHIAEHIVNSTFEGAEEWAVSRGCDVTPAGTKLLAKRLGGMTDVFETKSSKYRLSQAEDISGVKRAVNVYLDHASLQTYGRYRTGCVIDEKIVAKVAFPSLFNSPDTGILDLKGDEKGADILIDGGKKGNIRQTFILSVGPHSWKAMKCPEEKIKIEPNQIINRHCDKSGRIR